MIEAIKKKIVKMNKKSPTKAIIHIDKPIFLNTTFVMEKHNSVNNRVIFIIRTAVNEIDRLAPSWTGCKMRIYQCGLPKNTRINIFIFIS